MWDKLTIFQKRFTVIITICAGIGVTATSIYNFHQWVMKSKIEPYISEQVEVGINRYYDSRKGSLSYKLAEEMSVEREDVPKALGKMYLDFDTISKDWLLFHRHILPMLKYEAENYDVGLKVDKFSGRVMYLHTDGRIYRAFQDPDSKLYFFNDDDNKNQWCK